MAEHGFSSNASSLHWRWKGFRPKCTDILNFGHFWTFWIVSASITETQICFLRWYWKLFCLVKVNAYITAENGFQQWLSFLTKTRREQVPLEQMKTSSLANLYSANIWIKGVEGFVYTSNHASNCVIKHLIYMVLLAPYKQLPCSKMAVSHIFPILPKRQLLAEFQHACF